MKTAQKHDSWTTLSDRQRRDLRRAWKMLACGIVLGNLWTYEVRLVLMSSNRPGAAPFPPYAVRTVLIPAFFHGLGWPLVLVGFAGVLKDRPPRG